MYRLLATGAAATLAVATLTIAPAEAASYAVTLKTPTAKVDVAKTFTLAGSVAGSGKGSKTLKIQRKIGSGPWSTYTTVKTRSTGTFSKTLTMSSVGAKNFRVVAPAAGSTTQGISATRVVTGYTWLNLVDQPTSAQGAIVNVTRTVEGKTYTKSVVVQSSFAAVWNLDKKCDIFKTGVTIDPSAGTSAPDTTVQANTYESGVVKTAVAKVKTYSPLTGKVGGVTGFTFSRDSGSTVIDVLTPKVHCSTTKLPEWVESVS